MCVICGFIYDESAGIPDENIPAGTSGKMYLLIGYVLSVVLAKKTLKWWRSSENFTYYA